jgi:hypothetical protein
MSLKPALLAGLLLVELKLPTDAHDIYSPLRDSKGASCCNGRDCRPAPYRVTPTGVQMYVDGGWIAIPDETIRYRALPGDPGGTGGTHWCGTYNEHVDMAILVTHCAVVPPKSAIAAYPHPE